MPALERRAFELRASDDAKVLEGVALPYGSQGRVGGFTEEFRAGSVQLLPSGVLLNVLHREDRLLARYPDGGLELRDADDALHLRATMPDTGEAADARELVRTGVLRGFSIEFMAKRDEWQGRHRIVHEAIVAGVALVARPAYEGAVITEGRELATVDWLALQSGLLRKVGRRWRSL